MMAIDAVFLEDAGDLLGIGDFAFFGGLPYAADETAGSRRFGPRHRFARQKLVQCVRQVAMFGFLSDVADTVLVINSAVVPDDPFAIQNKDFRRSLGTELVLHHVLDVFQYGEGDLMFLGEASDISETVLLIRIDREKVHS